MASTNMNTQEFSLAVDTELRFEIETKKRKVVVELKRGNAEIFGTELVPNKPYEFQTGAKVGIFTYHGCTLSVQGEMDVHYVGKQTPMLEYLNTHAALEDLRCCADEKGENGPVVLVVGACDVGKSTVSRILLNYAVREGRTPLFVDLDVGQGALSLPGTIGTVLMEKTTHAGEGFSHNAPLVYQFGHLKPSENAEYFDVLQSKMAEVTLRRMKSNQHIRSSGMIINTCGWIRGEGYRHIIHATNAFQVNTIFVLDQERMYSELLRIVPKSVQVVFLPKSGGVVKRGKIVRAEIRHGRIREYFYGKEKQFYPHSFKVKWSDIQVYKVGAPDLPSSCMPIGMKNDGNKTKLTAVQPSKSMIHRILAITFCETPSDDVIKSNVAGFICVTSVDTQRQTITVLSPQAGPLPKKIFLLSEAHFMDTC